MTVAGWGLAWFAAAWAAPLAIAAPAAEGADPAARIAVERLGDGRYSLRPTARHCPRRSKRGRMQRTIALANAMWVRFGRKERPYPSQGPNPDAGLQTDSAIAGFWTSLPVSAAEAQRWRLWRSDPVAARQEHWSAAFTSWLMCEAGYSMREFARSMRHANYVIHARDRTDVAAHSAVDADQLPPMAGDLLCADAFPRGRRLAQIRVPHGLHCFLVVEVSGGEAHLIGGNVEGGVAKVRAQIAGSGGTARVMPTDAAPWLVLMRPRDPR